MPTRKEKVDAITAWLSTPADFRPVPTLRQLALGMGVTPDGAFYRLASSPDVAKRVLGITSAVTLGHLPAVFASLIKAAIGGNVRAADILLRHVREIVEKLPEPRETRPVHKYLEDVDKIARDLNKLADVLTLGQEMEHRQGQKKFMEPEIKQGEGIG